MERKSLVNLTLIFLFILSIYVILKCESIQGKNITVDDDGDEANFSTIKDAVSAAEHGDTILVKNGTYHGHVIVNVRVQLVAQRNNTVRISGITL